MLSPVEACQRALHLRPQVNEGCEAPLLLIGEFGAHGAADPASRLRWTGWVGSEAERLGLGWCYWALGTEFCVRRPDGAWDAELLAALLGPG